MFIICKEEKAERIFEKYRSVAAFSTSKNAKSYTIDQDKVLEYDTLAFLPDEDTITGIKNGDIKLKKVIRNAVKALYRPKQDNATIGLGMAQIMNIITANRKSSKGPAIIVFVLDPEDKERNKIMTKFISALFAEFGMQPQDPADKKLKKIFKGKKKKIIGNVVRYVSNTKGAKLSSKGADLKKKLMVFYELELRQSSIDALAVTDLGNNGTKRCIESLLHVYTGENLKVVDKKPGKQLAKKDKAAVDAYNSLKDILQSMDTNLRLPTVKFGAKRKKKKIVGPKMKTKKFGKYYAKRKNRGIIFMIYAHTMAVVSGLEIGTKEYRTVMRNTCDRLFEDGFGKAFVQASDAYAKANSAA